MVLKGYKRGINSGNTIRRLSGILSNHVYQKYGCLIFSQDITEGDIEVANQIVVIPSTGYDSLELSLNKSRRWLIPEHLKSLACWELLRHDIKIEVFEHRLTPANTTPISQHNTCTGYHSRGRSISSPQHVMNVNSAKRGYIREDHLGKSAKRRQKDTRQLEEHQTGTAEDATEDESSIQTFQYHVGYPDNTNRRFFKVLPLAACSGEVEKKANRSKERQLYSNAADYAYTDMMYAEDYGSNTSFSERTGERIINKFIASPPAVSTKSYVPADTEVLLKNGDVNISTLSLNMGDNYTESYCTPRVLTIDLSEQLGMVNRTDRLYMVLVLRAAGKGTDRYRVYCTGTHVTDEDSTCIPTLNEGAEYDFTTLMNLVLEHGHNLVSGRQYRPFTLADYIIDKQLLEYISTSSTNSMDVNNNEEEEPDRRLITTPTQFQRALSCNLQCGVCFEDLNDSVLHSAILPCQHYFCNECWSAHLTTNIREGKVHINCPEYECTREKKLRRHRCPNNVCKKLHHHEDNDDFLSVKCYSGTECCFYCRNEPHWPLTCSQLVNYYHKLKADGLHRLVTVKDTSDSKEEFKFGLPNTPNSYYNIACRHRVYKAPYTQAKLKSHCSKLLSTMKQINNLRTHVKQQSLTRYLYQAIALVLEVHNLLEFCAVLNSLTRGGRFYVSEIALLSYHVNSLEGELTTGHCTGRTLDLVKSSYELVRSHREQLIGQMSSVLS